MPIATGVSTGFAGPKSFNMSTDLRRIYIYGGLSGATRSDILGRMVNRNGKLVRDPRSATHIVLAHATARKCLTRDRLELPVPTNEAAVLVSEDTFKRWLRGDDRAASGAYGLDDLVRLSGLRPDPCVALGVFDVIAPAEGPYGYQDLATAKQAARLLGQGMALASIVKAGIELGVRGLRLSQFRLVEAPWGEVVQEVAGKLARLDGQFALVLDEEFRTADACFGQAEAYEAAQDYAEAERWYRRAMKLDRTDPAIPFNLGNVLCAQSRSAEAMMAFKQALLREPSFAEASFNLAGLYEAAGKTDEALDHYASTIALHPAYAQALYNFARLLTALDRFGEALPLWQAFIERVPDDPDIATARRSALLCRMKIRAAEDAAPTAPGRRQSGPR